MTALAAIWNIDGRPDALADCGRIMAAQRMYGPHGNVDWDDGAIALGCCRYQLLAEDRYDRQPLVGGGGRFVLVADVRLDNRDDLASALAIDPQDSVMLPDSAFLLRAWERWGSALFEHIAGDYAFVLWDSAEQQLVLARDHIGGRALHYHLADGFVAVASMPKGLHALERVPRAPDAVRNAEFLALLPEYGPRSFYEGVSRVEAGQIVTVSRSGVATTRHWEPSPGLLKLGRPTDYAEALREQLDRAIAARLRGTNGLVATHLSGGLDSGATTATAARLMAQSGGRVLAFTSAPRAGYDGFVPANRIGDESALAAATAGLYPNVEHVTVRTGARTMLDDLDRDFYLFDRPLLNSDIQHWWNAINGAAQKRGAGVVLSATMGNATFSYAGLELFAEQAAKLHWLRLWQTARATMRETGMRAGGALVQAFGPWLPDAMWRALNRAKNHPVPDVSVYTASNMRRFNELGIERRAREHALDLSYRPRRNGFETRLWILRRVDFGNNQKGALAGWGTDIRDVSTDRRLIEFCLSVPMEMFLRDGRPRALALDALADRLPPAVLSERRRGAQSIDWHEGLTAAREHLRDEVSRLADVPAAATALDVERMLRLIEQWPDGGWNRPDIDMPYRQALARGVTSGHFMRKASGSNA
ncbi:asparagine synthetase B family protein [Sphingomonas sp.]|jgi:asparagine synthase (glutamine-hydrolysing)|uniref:asparagine synthetase B family protein n=1 Tax=Sphingomonas sp. TaxID=28214 RepID=UPI002E363AB4|nr:asparagine synthase-related protein [Sphingomonas sp.]HEX4694080.1 asparagine synthase-related protein [Sphingomonas sp.]